MINQAVDFVLSKINLYVGDRSKSVTVDVEYEIPKQVVTEAMYLRGAIERMGTGTEEMTKQCLVKGLGKPEFIPNHGFQTIIRRTTAPPVEQIPEKYPTINGQVTEQVQSLIKILFNEMDRNELQEKLHLTHREHFRISYLQPAIGQGFVAMRFPKNPNHPKQRYLLTAKGIELKNKITNNDKA